MGVEKTEKVILMGLEDNIKSYSALEWVLDFYIPKPEYKIIIVHVKSAEHQGVDGEEDHIDSIKQKLKEICISKSVIDIPPLEVLEGDPTTVLSQTAKKYNVEMLVVGGPGCLVSLSGPLKGESLYDIMGPCGLMVRCPW